MYLTLLPIYHKDVLCSIGRVVKEICSVSNDAILQKKLVQDGVMDVLLKLSKKEIPSLKVYLSNYLSIYLSN
jgi:hypothetical protein